MWLPFEPEFKTTLSRTLDSADRFCGMLQDVAQDGYDLGVKHIFELGVFGNAGWLIAHDTALELILRTARQQGVQFELARSHQDCRNTWAEFVSSRRNYVREAADRDFAEHTEAGLRSDCRYKRVAFGPYDVEYTLSTLDVYECFVLGSEAIWEDVGYRSVLKPLWEELKEYVTADLIPEIASGSHKEWREVRPVLFSELLEIPWLPNSFWWRHLPSPA